MHVCISALKHSPSKKKGGGNRQRSVSDYDGKTPDKYTADRVRTASEAEAGQYE